MVFEMRYVPKTYLMTKPKRILVTVSFIGLFSLIGVYFQEIKKAFFGDYKQVTAQVIDTYKLAQNQGYYAQIVNYIFFHDNKVYEGSFTASEIMGLQSIGETVSVGFYSHFPNYSSLKRYNRGKRYYKHLRVQKFVYADSLGYKEMKVNKKAYQLFEYGEKAKLKCVLMGSICENGNSFRFVPRKMRSYYYKKNQDDPYKFEDKLLQPHEVKDKKLAMNVSIDNNRNFVEYRNEQKYLFKRIKKH